MAFSLEAGCPGITNWRQSPYAKLTIHVKMQPITHRRGPLSDLSAIGMIPLHEKIRLIRQAKGWTQEEVANKLDLSVNSYGDIERGNSDIRLSRLEQILDLFKLDLMDLLGASERNIFNFTHSTGTQTNHQYYPLSLKS